MIINTEVHRIRKKIYHQNSIWQKGIHRPAHSYDNYESNRREQNLHNIIHLMRLKQEIDDTIIH